MLGNAMQMPIQQETVSVRDTTLSVDPCLLSSQINDRTETRAQEHPHKIPVLTLPSPGGTQLGPRLLSHHIPQALACRGGREVDIDMELQGIALQRHRVVQLPGGSWVKMIKISIFTDSHCSSFPGCYQDPLGCQC